MEELMRKIGEYGFAIAVRYDTQRDSNNFTIMLMNGERICDTDTPTRVLRGFLAGVETVLGISSGLTGEVSK